jgi:hypothetical protein
MSQIIVYNVTSGPTYFLNKALSDGHVAHIQPNLFDDRLDLVIVEKSKRCQQSAKHKEDS